MQAFAWFVLFTAALGAAAVWMMAADFKIRHKAMTDLLDQKERDLLNRYREVEAMMQDLLTPSLTSSQSHKEEPFQSFLERVAPATEKENRRLAVEDLLAKGFDPEHIARDLAMGKGEVRLIASLMKKNAV